MNGYLQRGSMFVISSEQYQMLLDHANIKVGQIKSKMIDLGAGDGQVTLKLAPFYQHIFATETSKPMQNLLKVLELNYNHFILKRAKKQA